MRDNDLTLRIPRLWVAVVVSMLVHILLVLGWVPKMPDNTKNAATPVVSSKSMRVLLPPLQRQSQVVPGPAMVLAPFEPAPLARPSPVPPPVTPRKAPPPPVLTSKQQGEPTIAVAPSAPAPPVPSVEGDLSAMIAARRRARGEPAPSESQPLPVDQEAARRDQIVAANMATLRAPTLGNDPRRSGGIFEIRRMGIYDAEFIFFGWNKDINRRMSQVVEVKLGNNSDIRLAIVRKMIALIREHEKEEFSWQSPRLGRVITLSARAADNAGLEQFFMQEFFDTGRATR